MAYSVIITLTDMGSAVGPFDLYSDVDNYTTPFESNIPASAFTFGYYTTLVPNNTLTIKVQSQGECVNFILAVVQNLPTSTVTPTVTSTPTRTPNGTPQVTPTQTNTPSVTPTCGTFTVQYLKSELQGNSQIRFRLYNDAGFTSNANAVCNYTFTGTFDINGGAKNQPYSTVMATNDHDHSFNAGSQITAYTISTITYACPCVNVISNLITPTPSPTTTQTATPTLSLSATPTRTPSLTPTPSTTTPGGTLYVYARFVNTSQEFGYTKNGGSYIAIGQPGSSSCTFVHTITGLVNGDEIDFSTLLTCGINGDTADCPNSVSGCLYTHFFVSTTNVYITVDGSVCC